MTNTNSNTDSRGTGEPALAAEVNQNNHPLLSEIDNEDSRTERLPTPEMEVMLKKVQKENQELLERMRTRTEELPCSRLRLKLLSMAEVDES